MTTNGFDLTALDADLADTPFAGRLHFFPAIESTNTHAMQQGEAGAEHANVYFADEQTAGRGRGAHGWTSPPGTGLYVSTLLRPKLAPGDALWISLAAGLAVQQALAEMTGLQADLRWPNDLLLGKKKFCGILTEMNAEVTRIRHLVVGIGINVLQPEFPPELSSIATSLQIETGQSWSREELLTGLLKALHREVTGLSDPATTAAARASILHRLEAGSSWIHGKQVRVEEGPGYAGITAGLDERGFLRVRTSEGMRVVLSGGVREDK